MYGDPKITERLWVKDLSKYPQIVEMAIALAKEIGKVKGFAERGDVWDMAKELIITNFS